MNKKMLAMMLAVLFGGGIFMGCSDDAPVDEPGGGSKPQVQTDEIIYANQFGKEVLDLYYYWCDEISADLKNWDIRTTEDPIAKVDEIRYHEGEKYIDKWTMLTDDMASFNSSVGGVSTTYGWNLTVWLLKEGSTQCIGVVNFVHAGTPAAEAGIQRGDIIIGLNGTELTTENYLDLYYSSNLTVSLGRLDVESNTLVSQDKTLELTARTCYEDPVLCDSIYEFEGKKVGYLAYSSFDLASIDKLVDIGRKFKAAGIKELVLDLRYNGGGYVITENVLASMFAPQEAVDQKKVFEREVYNDQMTAAGYGEPTCLETEFSYPDVGVNVSTKDANIGLEKIYGLIGSGSASASEALLGGLMPYMDVRLIGSQSHGKYCTGWMLGAEDAYKGNCPKEIKDWGIYVMVSIYQNADGETPCMPDGLTPDIQVTDDSMLPYQLGDVNEPLLRAALEEAGRTYDDAATVQTRSLVPRFKAMPGVEKPVFGRRILLPPSEALLGNR